MELAAGDYRLVLAPERGGSILAFEWRGIPVMRGACGPSIFDVACFPLVPFSNRIAHGRFAWRDRTVRLGPNFPGADHPHPLHGFGWLSPWTIAASDGRSAVLVHEHAGGEWPWPYRAEQRFALAADGLTVTLALTNLGASAMPAGLGLHPYFPRTARTRYIGLHRGEWRNDPEGLPLALSEQPEPEDWWRGAPVGSRAVDTVYTRRSGPLRIIWPERETALDIEPSTNLAFTVIFTPPGEDFFCVEPVSHMTDAVNRDRADSGMIDLAPGETVRAETAFRAGPFGAEIFRAEIFGESET